MKNAYHVIVEEVELLDNVYYVDMEVTPLRIYVRMLVDIIDLRHLVRTTSMLIEKLKGVWGDIELFALKYFPIDGYCELIFTIPKLVALGNEKEES